MQINLRQLAAWCQLNYLGKWYSAEQSFNFADLSWYKQK